ncbi:MAG: flagellar assembly protein FliH [Undibacterium sp.]|uniref:flagellar assembly protein FliH n=1 Tax=Undibacterium sp. TaxID=1914977 RepID=UPI002715A627|nr:flagellar assembly protein FliH [Undibacterium sp.]MDO8651606.1 flagellar assembly protein FliH [Undibacterium sp.]
MSSIVPKGELSAFQRWEMTSFDEERPAPKAEQVTVAKIDTENADKAREIARLEGYASGYQEGYAFGLQEGKTDGFAVSQEEMNAQISTLQQVNLSLSEQIVSANQSIGQDLLNLAIELAQAMVKIKLEIDPEIIISLVKEAIEQLPSMQQPAQLILHPDDAAIIKSHIGAELDKAGWRIMVDAHIERGGCKLETAHNLLDATVNTRWQRLTDALKKNTPSSNGL